MDFIDLRLGILQNFALKPFGVLCYYKHIAANLFEPVVEVFDGVKGIVRGYLVGHTFYK